MKAKILIAIVYVLLSCVDMKSSRRLTRFGSSSTRSSNSTYNQEYRPHGHVIPQFRWPYDGTKHVSYQYPYSRLYPLFCEDGTRRVNSTCVDIDECEEITGLCYGHRCINTNGSYTCECYDSFHMIGNIRSCVPINQTKIADLLYTTSQSINLISLDTESNSSKLQIIYNGTHSPNSIDYSFDGNYIAWTDDVTHQITIAPFNYENPSLVADIIILENIENPISLTVDWIHNLVYWIDSDLLTINVISIFKPNINYILVKTREQPKDIVVNVFDSVLYWNHIGDKSKIMRSSQDGSNQTVLYSTLKQKVYCLSIDIYLRRIYFIAESMLYSINFDGKDELKIYSSQIYSQVINGMSVYYDYIYLSTRYSMFAINKFGLQTNDDKTLMDLFSKHFKNPSNEQILSNKIIDQSLQPWMENKCQISECSHLCLPVNYNNITFRCVCPESFSLIDGKYCAKNEPKTPITFESLQNEMRKLYENIEKLFNAQQVVNFQKSNYSENAEQLIKTDSDNNNSNYEIIISLSSVVFFITIVIIMGFYLIRARRQVNSLNHLTSNIHLNPLAADIDENYLDDNKLV